MNGFERPSNNQFRFQTRGRSMKSSMLLALASAAVFAAPVAEARITEVKITSRTPAFVVGGIPYSWPGVGTYEGIVGIAKGEVDPSDPRNAVIVDLALSQAQPAPGEPGKTPNGMVAYAFNFYILKPATLGNGNHRVMYEPPNRGGKTWTALARVSGGGDDPATISNPTVLANSFLMPRGYTMVWSGWEDLGPLTDLTASASFAIAKNPDGSTITGPSYEYIIASGTSSALAYPAADTADKTSAKLTHRVHLNDAPQAIPAFGTAGCAAPATVCWDYGSSAGTLAAAAAVGATNVKVSSVTGLAVGTTLIIDTESVTLTNVGTAAATGTGVTFTPALATAHASGAAL